MSKKIMICAVFMFFALSMNVALSDIIYPPELMEVSAPYPRATITFASASNASVQVVVMMESNDNPDSIFEFYKTEIAANGWTITEESQLEGLSGLMGVKGSNEVRLSIITDPSGKSTISLGRGPKQ
jgi:hypothetical protein